MINRIVLLVIDGLGVGALPDAAEYGDADADTLIHLADAVGGVTLPTLESLGLGHVVSVKGVRTMAQPVGCFGRVGFSSGGRDSVSGFWELAGVPLRGNRVRFASGLPAGIVAGFEQVLGRKVIGGGVGAYRTILREHGAEHLSSGAPLLWTDGQSACHLAAHERVMPMRQLAQSCRDARKALTGAAVPDRIVAHSFRGAAGDFDATAGRKDVLAEPPGESLFDVLYRSGQIVMGVGKAPDLFSGRGFTRAFSAVSAAAAFNETLEVFKNTPRGLLCACLDHDSDNPSDAAAVIAEFDRRLPVLFELLRPGDMVIITGDHGRDVTRPAMTPTREYVPLLVTGPRLAAGVNLGTRTTASDLGQTIVDALRCERLPYGDSFFEALRPG
jgi:phosphopentomutase